MKTRTKNRLVILGAVLVSLGAFAITEQCDRLWAQDHPQNASPEPVKALLSETEELRLVNTYQAAVLAQIDLQTAQQRVAKAKQNFLSIQDLLKEIHKWPAATTFEINGETGKVLVHLPPVDAKPEVKK